MPNSKTWLNDQMRTQAEDLIQNNTGTPENKTISAPVAKTPLLFGTITKDTRPEDLAREIVDHPNLWGMYSIADAIHRLLKFQNEET